MTTDSISNTQVTHYRGVPGVRGHPVVVHVMEV